jgi:hypothetical protein
MARAVARGDLAVEVMRMEPMREREKQEKEKVGPGTIPTYVHQADTLADDHKRVGLRGGHGDLCSLAT